ncbi:hypothetical protein, partial [Oceanobacter antarcticus]
SEVKRSIADGSVGSPHVRVGHRQALKQNTPSCAAGRGFLRSLQNQYAEQYPETKGLVDYSTGLFCILNSHKYQLGVSREYFAICLLLGKAP